MTNDTKIRKRMKKLYPHLASMPLEMLVHKVISMKDKGMNGTGFYDKFVNKIVGLHNKAFGKKKDKRHRQLKDGEVHAVLKNKHGALVAAQFSGPGTDLIGNTRDLVKKHGSIEKATQDDSYVDVVDRIAHQHDSKYYLNSGNEKAIREADIKFVLDHVKELKKPDRILWNIIPPMTGIMAKIGLENLGIMKRDAFADTDLSKERPEDIEMIRNVSKHLESQYGHGKYRPMRGGIPEPGKLNAREINEIQNRLAILYRSLATATDPNQRRVLQSSIQHDEILLASMEQNTGIDIEDVSPKNMKGNEKKGGKPRKPNPWIEHIRATAKKHGIKYGEAISLASKTWTKKK